MTIKIKKENILTIFLYVLFLFCYLFVLEVYGMGTTVSNIRYYLLFFATIISAIAMLFRKKSNIYGKNIIYIIVLSLILLITSYIKAKSVGQALAFRTLVQTSLVLLPALYSFELVNLLPFKTINKLMKFTLFTLIIVYFTEARHTLFQFFVLDNWRSIDIVRSVSFTESNICSESFLQLFFYFLFFSDIKMENNDLERKKNKRCLILSFIFTLLSFKRLAFVFSIIMIFFKRIVDLRTKVSNKYSVLLSALFSWLTVIYTKIMTGQISTSLDLFHLTTGRDYIISLWSRRNFYSYGYGTSMLVIGRYLEMDLVQLYLELGLIVLFIFCYSYFKISGKNMYSFIIMIYAFFNMLTASSLPYSLGWIILFITMFSVSTEKYKDEGHKIEINLHRFKKLFQKKNEEYE